MGGVWGLGLEGFGGSLLLCSLKGGAALGPGQLPGVWAPGRALRGRRTQPPRPACGARPARRAPGEARASHLEEVWCLLLGPQRAAVAGGVHKRVARAHARIDQQPAVPGALQAGCKGAWQRGRRTARSGKGLPLRAARSSVSPGSPSIQCSRSPPLRPHLAATLWQAPPLPQATPARARPTFAPGGPATGTPSSTQHRAPGSHSVAGSTPIADTTRSTPSACAPDGPDSASHTGQRPPAPSSSPSPPPPPSGGAPGAGCGSEAGSAASASARVLNTPTTCAAPAFERGCEPGSAGDERPCTVTARAPAAVDWGRSFARPRAREPRRIAGNPPPLSAPP